MRELINNIEQIVFLTPEERTAIIKAFIPLTSAKNEYWIKEGKYCNHIAFVQTGKLRVFYLDDSGNEITCYFVAANNFISSFTSFLTRTPTVENIAAIEDSELLVISRDELERLSDEIPKLQILRRVIAENLFIAMEKRIAALQSQTAYERYNKMLKENPDILLTVPLQYTASFLGITPQHLSRLRKKTTQQLS